MPHQGSSHLSQFRHHLPKLGVLFLTAFLVFCLYRLDWDLSRPSFVKGSTEFYLLALFCMTIGPGYTLGVYLYFKDRFYNESWFLLSKLFFYAILLAPLAALGEGIFQRILNYGKNSTTTEHFVFMFFVVGLLEELVKYTAVKRIAYHTKLFKQVYDGILFCAASALGFATIENIIYVFTGGDDAVGVALARSLTAIPSHIADGVIMGYGMGRAKAVAGTPKEKEWLAIGLGGAILLHGAYDFLLVTVTSSWQIPSFLLVMVGEWFVAYKVLKRSLVYTPFTHCKKCRQVIPQMASFCPSCGKEHRIVLTCWNCGVAVTKWTRKCSRCSVRMKFPWHLQHRRIKDLYYNRKFSICSSCQEEIPSDMRYCLYCGEKVRNKAG
jgi:protease PrsW